MTWKSNYFGWRGTPQLYTMSLIEVNIVNVIKFFKLVVTAVIPKRETEGAAGFDLRALKDEVLSPMDRAVIKTGMGCQIPAGHVGIIKPRSGLAVTYGVDVLAGVIDSDYTGEVCVILVNHGYDELVIKAGDRIAQMIVIKIVTESLEVESIDETVRGTKGFGSTGAS